MISENTLKIYLKYKGDSDLFARTASPSDLQKCNDKDWLIIENAIENIRLIHKKVVSKGFKQMVIAEIDQSFSSESKKQLYDLSLEQNI